MKKTFCKCFKIILIIVLFWKWWSFMVESFIDLIALLINPQ